MNLFKTGKKDAAVGSRPDAASRVTPGPLEKISWRYAISFLLLATVVVGFIWHDLRAGYLDTLAYWNVQLSSSAEARVKSGALWLKERRTDIELIIRDPYTPRLLSGSGSMGKSTAAQEGVERELAAVRQTFGYLAGAVLDSQCRIAAQVGMRPEMLPPVQDACQQVKPTGALRVDGFGMERGHVWVAYSVAVIAGGEALPPAQFSPRKLGAVVMVSDPWKDIDPLIAFESFPTRTSETLIVWKRDRDAFIFSPRLSIQGVEAVFRRPLDGESFESRVARESDVAFGEFIDYRGVRVLGAARRINAVGDSVARKVDRDEALSPYHRRAVLDGLVGALSLLLLGSVVVAQHQHAAARDSEARFKQQEAVRESERRYRVLFESAGDAIFLMRGDRFVDCNQKALELFGCGREQLVGKTPSAFSPPQQPKGENSSEAALGRIRLALEGQTLHFEWQHRRLDGTPFDAEVTLSRLEIAGEAHLLALVRDVTESKRVEEELAVSEERFRGLVQNATVGIYRTTPEGRILTVNPALVRMLGYADAKELLEHDLEKQGFEPSYPRHVFRERLEREGEVRGLEAAWTRRDGSIIFVRESSRAIRGESGQVLFYDGIVEDITERKRTEIALRASEARFRTLITDAPIAIGMGRNGITRYVNTEYVRLFGLQNPEETFGCPILDQHAPQCHEQFIDILRRRQQGLPTPKEYETVGRRKDGSTFPMQVAVSQVELVDGPVSLGFLTDLTERKRAEEALRESEERYRRLFEVESDAIILVEVESGRILDANPAALNLYGYSLEEFRSLTAPEVSAEPEKTQAGIAQEWTRAELRWHRKKDGTVFPVEITGNNFFSQGRKIHVAAIRDITERQRAEVQLRKLSLAVEQSPACVVITDVQGNIEYVNPKFTQITGYTAEEARGQNPRILKSGLVPAATYEELWKTVLSGAEWRGEFTNRKKNGELYWESASIVPIKDSGGVITHLLAVKEDITERKRAEEALQQSEQRYKDFISHSHEGVWRVDLEQPIPVDLPEEESVERLLQYGYVAECNLAFARNLGCATTEELVGRSLRDWIPFTDEERWVSYRSAARGGWRSRTTEVRGLDKVGNLKSFLRTEIPIVENGMLVRVWGITRDITELKRAEEELRLTRFSVEHASDSIIWSDSQGRLLYANQAACRSMGRSLEELLRLTISEIDPLFPKGAWDAHWENLKTRGAMTFETESVSKQGGGFPVEVTANYLEFDGKGYNFAFGRDITERKRAEDALRESEQRYKDFISHSHEGVWRVDLDQPIPLDLPALEILEKLWEYGYLAECNLAHARNFGFSGPEEILGQRLKDLIPPSDPQKMAGFRAEALMGWVDRTMEFQSHDKSGHLKHYVRTEVPIVENGMLVRVWGITRDVTEIKQAEAERQRTLEQLRALAAHLQSIREEERKRVAREIHDQLGQALTAIKIDLSSLVQELPPGEKRQKKRASSIRKLLDESIQVVRRISTELRPGILDDLGLVATIEWVGEEFESRTGTRCRLSLPQGDIAVDPERATAIFRILQETLTNVARHAEASEVEVRMVRGDGDLTLEVHDNGKGIPKGKLSAHASLGILGMRERAILLGGELTISSPAGNGTTVRVRIPEGRQT